MTTVQSQPTNTVNQNLLSPGGSDILKERDMEEEIRQFKDAAFEAIVVRYATTVSFHMEYYVADGTRVNMTLEQARNLKSTLRRMYGSGASL